MLLGACHLSEAHSLIRVHRQHYQKSRQRDLETLLGIESLCGRVKSVLLVYWCLRKCLATLRQSPLCFSRHEQR